VLRAEEWLSSAPRHLQLYRALGYTPPEHGHLPMILGPDRAKLSKRHGATSILEYRDDGFLPDALRNFMVLLGWSLDDKTEVMHIETIQQHFTLDRVGKPAAIFDVEKLSWMNGVYIREMSAEALAEAIMPFLEKGLDPSLLPVDRDYLLRIVPLIQERLKVLTEAPEMVSYFFEEQPVYDPANLVQRGMSDEETVAALEKALPALEGCEFRTEALENRLRELGEELELTPRRFFGTLRWAVTGRNVSPPLFETMEVLGWDRVIARLNWALTQLSG